MIEKKMRAKKSEQLLKQIGSDYLSSLPLIESENETRIRSNHEIGRRIICLLCVAAAADGLSTKRIINWLKNESLYQYLSLNENTFLNSENFLVKDKIKYSWKSECAWILLWAVGKVERNLPIEQCNIQEILKAVPYFESPTKKFIESIQIRKKSEILDMSDFIYRAHWATRQHQIDNKTKIGNLNPDVVMEWHYAINWLTCYDEIDNWDAITTDT